jgi:hypothetical protein
LKIARHDTQTVGDRAIHSLDKINERLSQVMSDKEKPFNMGWKANEEFRAISYAALCQGSHSEVYQHFFYCLQFGLNHFKLAMNPEKPVQLNVGNSLVNATGFTTREYIGISDWQMLFYIASILRDREALDFLDDLTIEFMDKISGARPSPIDSSLIYLMKALAKKQDLTKLIHEFTITYQSSVEDLTTMRENFYKLLTLPMVKVMEALNANHQEAFNLQLSAALTSHYEFYKEEREDYGLPGDPFGWLSFKLLFICAYAHDRGIKIDVESDYIPAWLLHGDFKDCKLTVQ